MSCNLSTGFTLGCNDSIGGIKKIYIGKFDQLTYTIGGTPAEVTAGSGTVYTYEPLKNSASATFNPTVSLENGTVFYTHSVSLSLKNINASKREELEALAKARVGLFVELNSGKILAFGTTNGMYMTAGTFQTGAAFGDLQGYQLTFTSDEPVQPYTLQDATMTAANYTVSPTTEDQ
jgi:hypothetical protein